MKHYRLTLQAITRALNGTQDGGMVPPIWAAILEALGLELTASVKTDDKRAQ